jgi:hypothetical protein
MLSAAELASISSTVAGSLDITITRIRTTAKAQDGYGHTTSPTTSNANYLVNIIKPTATQLQAFADIIGSQRALMIRYMPASDIKQGDIIQYQSVNWLVQSILNAESYTIGVEALMTAIF